MVILVNPSAGGGNALKKWRRVETALRRRLGPMTVLVPSSRAEAQQSVAAMLGAGETELIAGGGDGTVNLLVASVLAQAPVDLLPRIKIGAVGLGSSNDFHKPFRRDRLLAGIPCRTEFGAAVPHDVGLLRFEAGARLSTRHWIVNASVGLAAEANWFFNQPDALLRGLKRSATGLAIVYAAARTLATHRRDDVTMTIDESEPFSARAANIGVKNPHFAGSFCYDSPYEPASGQFHIHLCEDISARGLLRNLWRSAGRRFSGLPVSRSWRSSRLAVQAGRPFAVEFDGEVARTHCALFTISERAIQLCT